MPWTLTLLGGFELRRGPERPAALPTRKAQALLAYLALPAGRLHPRDKLASLLWGDLPEAQARASLRQAVYAIRKTLGEAAILHEGANLGLAPDALTADVHALEAAARDPTPDALERIGALYRGDLLAGLALSEPPFEEWLLTERERLREAALEALARLLSLRRAAGRVDDAIETARSLLAIDPLQEAVHRTLMRLYAQAGRREAALRQYQHCVAALDRELRAEPEPETRALYQEIVQQRGERAPRARADEGAPDTAGEPAAPFVGRAREMARLAEVLDAGWRGQGRFVGIGGAAGVGKSRLAAELAALATRRGGRVLLGRCYETERVLPLAPWIDALRSGRVAEEPALTAGLAPAWRAELSRLLPELGEGETAGPAGGDPTRTFEAVAHLLSRLARAQPLLLVLEDLQWADELSVRLLAYLARRIGSWPAVILGTGRVEDTRNDPFLRQTRDELRRGGHGVQFRTGPLSRAETARLARALLPPGTRADEGLDDRIWEATEGNAFMIVESARALRAMAPGAAAGRFPLPAGVRALVLGRLERLDADLRRLVETAAVIGRQFAFDLLAAAVQLPETEVAAGVEALVRREIFRLAGDGFEFTHDRIREVARDALLPQRRALLHREVAAALERRGYSDRARRDLAIGTHYLEAGDGDRAAHFLARAGAAASARGAGRDAVACCEAALGALARVPDDHGRRRRAFDLDLRLAYERYQLGEPERALEILRSAESLLAGLDDPARTATFRGGLTYVLGTRARYREALEAGAGAVDAGRAARVPRVEAYAHSALAMVHHALGAYRQSMACARAALGALEGTDAPPPGMSIGVGPEFTARAWLALSAARLADFAEALGWGREAVDLAEASGEVRAQVSAYHALGSVHLARGDLEAAARLFEAALALCEERPLAWYASRVRAALASTCALSGQVDRAVPLAERAVAEAESNQVLLDHTRALNHLAAASMHTGRLDEARQIAQRALALARAREEPGDEAWTLLLLGEIGARAGSPVPAIAHLDEALRLAGRLEMRALEARAHLALGDAHERAGKRAEARAHLQAAAAQFAALGMDAWRVRGQARLAALGG